MLSASSRERNRQSYCYFSFPVDGAQLTSSMASGVMDSEDTGQLRSSTQWPAECAALLEQRREAAAGGADVACEKAVTDSMHSLLGSLRSAGGHQALKTHLDSLVKLMALDQSHKSIFHRYGGVQLTIHTMAISMPYADLQSTGCRILADVAEHDAIIQEDIGKFEGVNAILDTIRFHLSNVQAQTHGMRAFRNLTWSSMNRARFRALGALGCLVQSMLVHPSDAKLQEYAASTIAHVVEDCCKSRKVIGSAGGIGAITNAMRAFGSNAALQTECSLSVRNLSLNCFPNAVAFRESDTIDLIFSAMRSHPRLPVLLNQALGAVGNIFALDEAARNAFLGNEKFEARLLLIVGALDSYPADAEIAQNGCAILLQLCVFESTADITNVRRFIGIANSAQALVTVLKCAIELRNHQTLQQVCLLIQFLCAAEESRGELGRADCVHVLLAAIEANATSEEHVCVFLLVTLSAALSGDDTNKVIFSNANGAVHIHNMMSANSNTQRIQEEACTLLDNAADGQQETTANLMSNKQESIAAIARAMADFPMSASLQESGCSVLVKIAGVSAEDSSEIVTLGARAAVEKARSNHAGNPAVESLANQLMSLLTADSFRRGGRGVTPKGSASSRLRSRSRTVGQLGRSRSKVDRSKSPTRRGGRRGRGSKTSAPNSLKALPEIADEEEREEGEKPRKTTNRGRTSGRKGRTSLQTLNTVLE